MRRCILLFGVVLGFLPGCGGGGGGQVGTTSLPISVSISPFTASVPVAGNQAFAASVLNTNNKAVTWTVQEGAAGGSISATGVYTAPNTAGTYHVTATSQADIYKYSTIAVTVHLTVNAAPATATVTLGQTQQFTATVAGATNKAVNWSVQEGAGGGSISATGVYTAPGTPGTYHVLATSQADPTQSASTTITVQAGSASGTIQ